MFKGSQNGSSKRITAPKTDDLEKKFEGAIKDGSIKNFKVAEIREFLSLKGLPDTGKKSYLINIIEEYFDN